MRSAALLTFFTFIATCSARVIQDRYVVELHDLQALSGSKRSFGSLHENFYRNLRKRDVPFDVVREYSADGVFVGASLKLSADQVGEVAKMSGVKAIRPVIEVPRPKPVKVQVVNPTDSGLPDGQASHIMTGVDKLHAKGIAGKGITIGIIDTGIDYNHPFLGGGFGPGHKVIGGYDFVGDDYTSSKQPVPDPDPMDCEGHGTHVAGIIGANPGNPFNISGVAYEASINAYRIFGCSGDVSDDIIIEALLRGYQDGNDILSLSLGGPNGWPEASSAVVASRLEDKGVVLTIAQGNDGSEGPWAASSPASGAHVFSIASVDNIKIPAQNATVHGVTHDPIVYLSTFPLNATGEYPIYATSTDTTKANDACDPLPDSTPDLSDKVVLIRRGTCTFAQKLGNAAAKGGKVFLIYNNVPGYASITTGNYTAALVAADDGAFLVNQFASKSNVSLSFPQSGAYYELPDPHGGFISSFSTYGLNFDLELKPTVGAPGGNIISTYPLAKGGYTVESGTSMATPFVAGSAALVLQTRGKSIVKGIRDLFQTTASPLSSGTEETDLLQTLAVSGAGLVQVNIAVDAKTIVSPGQLLLNDTAHFNPIRKFTIKNTGSETTTYKLTHVPAGTAPTVGSDGILTVTAVTLNRQSARVDLSQNQVTVRPGSEATVSAVFHPPSDVDEKTFPIYSGFIQITSLSESLRVSYAGLAASIKNKQVIDTTDTFFGFKTPAIVNTAGQPGVNASYTLKGDDQPILVLRLAFGTPLLRLDLVPENFKAPPHKRSLSDSFWYWISGGILGDVKTLGALAEYDYVPRNYLGASTAAANGWTEYAFNGTLADGSAVKDGSYKVFLRALRVAGNPKVNTDFESWLSPTITIKRS
ncbi:subtilisin-like protease [Irpex rosettiformis]|uniref:Subtilisin-like protease n=1 Tax=Irpex rosettiformis TaxID=378272 RepID=A0ACB8U1V0_9APHY|nr:subtilisin-like protease [Irpex rosettiformis]